MKKHSNILILACIPAVFVLILLGTGLPQRFLPAVRVGDASYTVAAYNFYYYEAYASYVTEHYDELDELGLDLSLELKNQRYDENATWAQYFRTAALADMREYTILYDAAMADGFDASEEISAVREKKAEELRDYCVANNIQKVDTYLVGLYDAGMTEAIFYRELDRRTIAEAYRETLMTKLMPDISGSELLSGEDYRTADAVVSLFRPGIDRMTGESEARQWDNAEILAEAALARANAWGGDLSAFTSTAMAYSELEDTAVPDGRYPALTKEDLEEPLEAWCFDSARKNGDTAILRGSAGWYLLYFNGWGESAASLRERAEETARAYTNWLAARTDAYPIRTNALGMQIAR